MENIEKNENSHLLLLEAQTHSPPSNETICGADRNRFIFFLIILTIATIASIGVTCYSVNGMINTKNFTIY